jgi:hypothetical protein
MKAKRYPRGAAFREACHAVVAWSLGLGVRAVRISDDDARDAAEIGCADLSLIEQIALCSAGIAAENAFECPADELAGTHDREKIYKLLKANEISEEDQCEALRVKGYNWARECLGAHMGEVIRLAERLAQRGRVDASEFLHLMRAN